MLVPYFSLADMLKYVPGDETLTIEATGKKEVSVSWSAGKSKFPTDSVLDFPTLAEMTTRAEGSINGDVFIPSLAAALPYVATDDKRPVLSGVTVILGNPVEVAAGDGFRMSHQILGLSFPLEEKIIIPAHSVAILEHVFAKTPRPPAIPVVAAKRQLLISLVGENRLIVDFGKATVVVNLTTGSPPEWLSLIPKGEPILESQIFAPQLEATVKGVRAVAKDGKDIVRMVFTDGKLTVSAKSEDMETEATMDTIYTKGQGRTAINYKYLLEYLSGKQGIVTICQYDKAGPLSFQYQNLPRVIIMPMLVQWGDEEPTARPEAPEEEAAAAEVEATEDKPQRVKPKRHSKKRVVRK
jgi:DNA polymerase III sliding clamp (beta) subunit (PCNA family)